MQEVSGLPKGKTKGDSPKRAAPAITPEGREQQLINLAYNEAEKQIVNGTASSQIITHFLKLGAEKTKLENLKLEKEIAFLQVKADSVEAQQKSEELYENAIKAFRRYSGQEDVDEQGI